MAIGLAPLREPMKKQSQTLTTRSNFLLPSPVPVVVVGIAAVDRGDSGASVYKFSRAPVSAMAGEARRELDFPIVKMEIRISSSPSWRARACVCACVRWLRLRLCAPVSDIIHFLRHGAHIAPPRQRATPGRRTDERSLEPVARMRAGGSLAYSAPSARFSLNRSGLASDGTEARKLIVFARVRLPCDTFEQIWPRFALMPRGRTRRSGLQFVSSSQRF